MFFFFYHKITFAQEYAFFPTQCFCPKPNTFVQNLKGSFKTLSFFNDTWPIPFVFIASLPCVPDC